MKLVSSFLIVFTLSFSSFHASARDDIEDYSIAEVLASDKAKDILGTDIQFYFGDQPHPPIIKTFVETRTNNKTNGSNKTDQAACEWVFLSAMKVLRNKARSLGANAVVNIRSNYRDNMTTSATTFKCGSGMLVSGVALIGDVVELEKTDQTLIAE